MTSVPRDVRKLLSYLVLSAPTSKLDEVSVSPEFTSIFNPISHLLQGKSAELIKSSEYESIIYSSGAREILQTYPARSLAEVLADFVQFVRKELNANLPNGDFHFHILAIAFLQTFIQLNFTGPCVDFGQGFLFNNVDESQLHSDALRLLALEGQSVYELMTDPVYFVVASLMLESLCGAEAGQSLVSGSSGPDADGIVESTVKFTEQAKTNALVASSFWWRCRLLQVHMSLFAETPGILTSISTLLMNPDMVNCLWSSEDQDAELQQHIQMVFYLENARICIHSHTEHLANSYLARAKQISQLQLVLSGAKGKRTKFQTFTTSNLIVLARSRPSTFYATSDSQSNPETFNLDSDILLEKPHYESLEDMETEEHDSKRIKIDFDVSEDQPANKLLPIALRQEDIPAELKQMDPNEQPPLNELDNVQLLLRLCALRQTSPSGDALVEEELMALVSRILFAQSQNVNWSIFGRALWERSLLETGKAKTIERGILQMTSLIEEIGIKIKSRILPVAEVDGEETEPGAVVASRLRFIHQLPLKPQWSLDVTLAEKYMSLGVLRSAIEIYERLQLSCEAALCYAAVENEKEAERILLERISSHPEDARAVSILGDLRQDPELWVKAWEIGKYHKAKASLSRYFYQPPANSGAQRNFPLAIQHMHDSLSVNPLNYENWFFYGCLGLETELYDLASEAFTRCVALDETNPHAWSNLATSLVRQDKDKPALNALKKAIQTSRENKRSWKIYENFLIVAMKLHEWNDVLVAARELIDIRSSSEGEKSVDIPVIEKLVEILVSTDYPTDENQRLTHYQTSCIDLVCNILPKVITTSARCWRIVSRVELWRKKPWAALECQEKAYRAISGVPDLESNEKIWDEAVDACADLVASYESLGELPGKHGADDVVCQDWKYKARTTIRSLMSKGKSMWEDSPGWYRLQDLKEEFSN